MASSRTPATTWVTGHTLSIDYVVGTPSPETDLRRVEFHRAHVVGRTIPLDWTALAVGWSEFERCVFTQRSRPILNQQGFSAQGSFAHHPSVFRGCRFEGIRFGSLGHFSLGRARFENCTFIRCRFTGSFADDADFVGCTFVGKIDGGAWFGPAE